MSPYNIKALFTLVPVDPALNIIHNKLHKETTLSNRTPLSIPSIMSLLCFCLKSTFFTFQDKYYEQVKGAAMGSSMSTVIANLFMEDFKTRVQSSLPSPPRIWLRFIMTLLLFTRKNTHNGFSPIQTPWTPTYSSPQTCQTSKVVMTSCTILHHKDQMAPSSPWFTGSQHIQISIYIGTVTTASPKSAVFTTLFHTGPSMSVPTNNY